MMARLMEEAGIAIAEERWFSNLATKGNTGSASIFIILDEFLKTRRISSRQATRSSVSYRNQDDSRSPIFCPKRCTRRTARRNSRGSTRPAGDPASAPIAPDGRVGGVADMLKGLMAVWHDYRSQVFPHRSGTGHHGGTITGPITGPGWNAGFPRCAKAVCGCAVQRRA